jgi:putative DNA primase/helicase
MRINHSRERGAMLLSDHFGGMIVANFVRDNNAAALAVIENIGSENLIANEDRIYKWNGTRWQEISLETIKLEVLKLLAGAKFTSANVSSIANLVKTHAFRPDHRFNQPAPDQVAVENGVLTLVNGNWTLRPHKRENFRTIVCPVSWDPNAKAPRTERFLFEIFEGCPDSLERQMVLCEALGVALLPCCRYEKFFLLLGGGANGKSVFLRLIPALLGNEFVSAVQPSEFERTFQRAHLENKLANIVTEIAEGAQIHDAQLKSLVSGELTTAERKHQRPFEFLPIATHFFASNHLPSVRDFSAALFRRAVLVEFPNVFEGSRRDPKLSEKLLEELPGVLNLALIGAKRVITNGGFTVPASSIVAANQWRLESDQAAQFIEEVCERSAGQEIASGELYEQYRAWARESGIRNLLGRNNFSVRLQKLGFPLKKGTKGSRYIRGLKIVNYQNLSRVA